MWSYAGFQRTAGKGKPPRPQKIKAFRDSCCCPPRLLTYYSLFPRPCKAHPEENRRRPDGAQRPNCTEKKRSGTAPCARGTAPCASGTDPCARRNGPEACGAGPDRRNRAIRAGGYGRLPEEPRGKQLQENRKDRGGQAADKEGLAHHRPENAGPCEEGHVQNRGENRERCGGNRA